MQLQSVLTCPTCRHQSTETMPTDACQFFYDCKGCGARLKPLAGDCCVFCSYGSGAVPPDPRERQGRVLQLRPPQWAAPRIRPSTLAGLFFSCDLRGWNVLR